MKAQWVIGIVIAAALDAQPPNCRVNVYINKGMALPIGMLPDATAKAAAIFREVGVDIRMRNGVPRHDLDAACGPPIVIEFENAGGYGGTAGALAYAKPYLKSGTSIHVFIDRLRHGRDASFANTVLAHVMVHEIAHVLQGVARHSDEGTMKAVWSGRDYQQMKLRPLTFAPEDVDLIHEGILRRIAIAGQGE
jgi:hypothetical protein